jgi:hypothetical protein
MIVEILGWLSTGLTILSFIPKGESRIRLINGIACISWIVYATLIKQNPLIVVNAIVLGLHIRYYMQQRVKAKPEVQKVDKVEKADPDFMYNWIRKHSGKP